MSLLSPPGREDDEEAVGIENSIAEGHDCDHNHEQGTAPTGTQSGRRGSRASAATGTTSIGFSARPNDEPINRSRFKKPRGSSDPAGHIDLRIRTVEVRGEVGLPD